MSEEEQKMNLFHDFVIVTLRAIVVLLDIVTFPLHVLLQRPFKYWSKAWSPRTLHQVTTGQDGEQIHTWSSLQEEDKGQDVSPFAGCQTFADMSSLAIVLHGSKKCLGTRKVISEHPQTNSKVVKKVLDTNYQWLNYNQANVKIERMIGGLKICGIKKGDKVALILETRSEWTLICHSVMRMSSVLCTMYNTLGIDGMIYGLNELEAKYVIINSKSVNQLEELLHKLPFLTHVIVVGDYQERKVSRSDLEQNSNSQNTSGINNNQETGSSSISGSETGSGLNSGSKTGSGSNSGTVTFISLSDLEEQSSNSVLEQSSNNVQDEKPKPDDLALIMYTSGTTGIPKGVMFSQSQFVAGFLNLDSLARAWNFGADPIYLAYLPSAHIFEFMVEMLCWNYGIGVAYSSPLTAFDFSSGLMLGTRGDVIIAKPTFMIAVPLILDKVSTAVKTQIQTKGPLMARIFTLAVNYVNFWSKYGFKSHLVSKILFKKTKALFGGKVQTLIVGSAPFSEETQNFSRAVLDVQLLQGFGTTETMATTCITDPWGDHQVGFSGTLARGVKARLVSWPEGNYYPQDKPNPRGELWIGAKNVSIGYFKKENETRESFETDLSPQNGDSSLVRDSSQDSSVRWFKTGDVALIDKDLGTIKIIDRKKDMVKLPNGEFISLGKIESCLKRNPILENICVINSPTKNSLVAIILPNRENLKKFFPQTNGHSHQNGNSSRTEFEESSRTKLEECSKTEFEEMSKNELVIQNVLESVRKSGLEAGLKQIELPTKIYLATDEWTPSNNLVTASMKMRRRQVVNHYQDVIQKLFDGKIN